MSRRDFPFRDTRLTLLAFNSNFASFSLRCSWTASTFSQFNVPESDMILCVAGESIFAELLVEISRNGKVLLFGLTMEFTRWLFQRSRGASVVAALVVAGWKEAQPCLCVIIVLCSVMECTAQKAKDSMFGVDVGNAGSVCDRLDAGRIDSLIILNVWKNGLVSKWTQGHPDHPVESFNSRMKRSFAKSSTI